MRTFRLIRWILVPLGIAILIFWGLLHTSEVCPCVEKGGTAILYANQCQDDIRGVFLKAIEEAKESIHLVIYSFTDPKLLHALQKKADEGVAVSVFHDSTSSQSGIRKLLSPIEKTRIEVSGLMHEKILVTDHSRVWIGSANWTRESLRVQKNLVVGIYSPELAQTIEVQGKHHYFSAGEQRLEFWRAELENHAALLHLVELIDGAQSSIRIGMFAWTHPELTSAIVRAQKRGVKTEVVLDPRMAKHVSKKAMNKMQTEGVEVRTFAGIGTFHHKFAWIDGTTLINGSLNWTNSAFKRNWDCFLILYELTYEQQEKMAELWHIIRATSRLADKEHLSVLWQRPHFIIDELLEPISIAA